MRKLFLVLGMVVPFVIFPFGEGEGQNKDPQIRFEEREYNWGTAFEGDKVVHVFSFTNTGDGELVIDKVSSSCGCTVALLSEKVIPPGEKGEIKATFDSTRRAGKQTKTITVQSNDPNEPSAKLTITGLIKKYIEVKPDPLNLGTVFRGEPVTQTIRIIPPKTLPNFKITKVESNQPYLVAEVENPGSWGERFTAKFRNLFKKKSGEEKEEVGIPITVTLKPDAPIGRIRANLKIETNDDRKPSLTVRVTGTVSGPIQVVPTAITFQSSQIKQGLTRKVTLTSRKGGLKILKVETNSPHILVETQEKESGKSYEIEVTLSPDAPKGRLQGSLTIQTNFDDQSLIKVPIYGIVQ